MRVTVVTTHSPDPTGLRPDRPRRRRQRGARIVEQKDATDDELAITEINSGIYAFDGHPAAPSPWPQLGTDNAQGEKYLTDVVGIARARAGPGRGIRAR
jgi:bifunctional UDP-N-acetylglucosamine pyrophosphorylase/glucosamine-1-phosphate N-acetyltransferase